MRIPHKMWLQIIQSKKVRDALAQKAEQLAAHARSLAAEERVDTKIEVVNGTRPKGRPYSRVTSSNLAAEHGDSWTRRARILGRTVHGKKAGQ